MAVMEAEHISFGYKDKPLFNDLTFKLMENDHLGLVGVNGIGKSTLLNLIADKMTPDKGKISWVPHVSFSYLDQNLEVDKHVTIEEYLNEVYRDLFKKEHEMNQLYESLGNCEPEEMESIMEKADNIQAFLEKSDFYTVKSQMDTILSGLGVKVPSDSILATLSGGERCKVFLSKMLLEEKDVLLLDEPTNFLDEAHVDWLAKYLKAYKKPFIVISHQVSFMREVANAICEVKNSKCERYSMGYDEYLAAKEVRDAQYVKDYEAQQRVIKKTEEFIQKNIVRASTTKQAQARRKALEKIDVIQKPTAEFKKMTFKFPFTKGYEGKTLTVKNLVIGYNGQPLLKPINMSIDYGDHVLITGKNGIGKSTFIKTILKYIKPIMGNINFNPLTKIVYFEQEMNSSLDITPIEYIQLDYPLMDYTEVRSLLGTYGLTGDLPERTLDELSGGERTKVRFAKLSLEKGNLLILDEPTNNLDIHAKEALLKALKAYPGTMMIVSHEKDFSSQLDLKMIDFEKQVK